MKSLTVVVIFIAFVEDTLSFVLQPQLIYKVLLQASKNKDSDIDSTQQIWDLGGTFENYSNSLSMTLTQQRKNVEDELELYNDAGNKRKPLLKKVVQIAEKISKYSLRLNKTMRKGTLIFVRGVRFVIVYIYSASVLIYFMDISL